jgi:hypothetical protein
MFGSGQAGDLARCSVKHRFEQWCVNEVVPSGLVVSISLQSFAPPTDCSIASSRSLWCRCGRYIFGSSKDLSNVRDLKEP